MKMREDPVAETNACVAAEEQTWSMSPCKTIYLAAWQLRKQVIKYGNTWAAVGAYHSATPALRDQYAQQIAAILRRWGVLPGSRSVADNGVTRASVGAMD